MTAPLWVIAAAAIALVALVGLKIWNEHYAGISHLDVLTEADVADLTRPYVDQLSVMALDDAEAPDSVWNGREP
jgi:hypothetical protein